MPQWTKRRKRILTGAWENRALHLADLITEMNGTQLTQTLSIPCPASLNAQYATYGTLSLTLLFSRFLRLHVHSVRYALLYRRSGRPQ